MAAAVNGVANGGEVVSPSLVQGAATTASGREVGTETTTKRRAVSAEAARADRADDGDGHHRGVGTAPGAGIEGYRVAGKTGTAQEVGGPCNCYADGGTAVSFAGLRPGRRPALHRLRRGQASRGPARAVAAPPARCSARSWPTCCRSTPSPPTGTTPPHDPDPLWGRDAAATPAGRYRTAPSQLASSRCPSRPHPSERAAPDVRSPGSTDWTGARAPAAGRRRRRGHRAVAELASASGRATSTPRCRAAAPTARRTPPRRSPPVPWPCSPTRRARGCSATAERPGARPATTRVPVLGRLAARLYGDPAQRADPDGGDRHPGQDHDHPAARGRAHDGRGERGGDRHRRHPDRRPGREDRADHPGGARPARAVRGDGRAGRARRARWRSPATRW